MATNTTTLKEILSGTSVDGKKARRILRREAAKKSSPLNSHEHRAGWTFTAAQATHVRSLLGLSGSKKSPAAKTIPVEKKSKKGKRQIRV